MSHFKSIEQVLRCDVVSQHDKRRILTCLQKQEEFKAFEGLLGEPWPGAKNTSIQIGDSTYIYQVNLDKSVQHLKTLKSADYWRVSMS